MLTLAGLALTTGACGDDGDTVGADTPAAGTGTGTESTAGQPAGSDGADDVEASGDPVVVGVISSYTGPFGIYGDPMELAMNLRLEAAGFQAGDHPIEVVYEDDATDPAIAVQKATKLIEEDGASVIVCCVNAGSTFAVAPLAADAGVPMITPIANPAGVEDNPNAFVAGPSVQYDSRRLAEYAAEELGYETAVVVAMDMAYGQGVAAAMTEGFTSAGGEVVETIMTPFGTEDFGSFLGRIPDADVVLAGFAGADGIAFVQQYDQFGLADRMPLLAHGPLITELLLQTEGPAAVGTTAGFYYTSQLDNAENEAFISALNGANPDIPPSHFTAGAWATASVLLAAIEAADDPTSGESMREAVAGVEIEAPWGTMTFDEETGYVLGPTYVYTVVQDGDRLRHDVVATIE